MLKSFFFLLILAVLGIASIVLTPEQSGDIRVAVASNFREAMQDIVRRFETKTDLKVTLIFGSTGKHYAQIKNGAPIDAFFAADGRRPELLENEGVAVIGSRFTYAVGQLVLWSPAVGYVDPEGRVLGEMDFRHLAIANPRLAPYGRAAQDVLQAIGLWDELSDRIVRGENISQTFQFVISGNAELGFVAYSQVSHLSEGSLWEVPQSLYEPVEQQALLLNDIAGARAFLAFVQSDEVREIIRGYGYATP